MDAFGPAVAQICSEHGKYWFYDVIPMSSATIRRRAFIVAAMMLAVCAAFSVPAFTGTEASGDEAGTIVIVPESDPSSDVTELVEEYAKIYSEVKHQESMGHDVKVADPKGPSDEARSELIDGMKDMVGKDHFVPDRGDRPEMPGEGRGADRPDGEKLQSSDRPEEARSEPPEKDAAQVVSSSDLESVPDPEFIQKVADLIEKIGAPDSASEAKALRDYASWLLLQDLNDILSTGSIGFDRKDGDDDAPDHDGAMPGEPCIAEADDEDPGSEPLPDPSPYGCTERAWPHADVFSYYTGVTTCGQILL